MSVYIDTSAIMANMDAADPHHADAARIWLGLVEADESVVISSYTIVETTALLQSRRHMGAVRCFATDMLPLMTICWVTEELHTGAMLRLLTCSSKGGPSLVDCAAFQIIEDRRLAGAFAYDKHFSAQSFATIG